MNVPEFQTIDVGRIETEVKIYDGSVYKVLIIGRIVLHGNRDVVSQSASQLLEKFKSGQRKSLRSVSGAVVLTRDIIEYNTTKESAELVTFAIQPKA